MKDFVRPSLTRLVGELVGDTGSTTAGLIGEMGAVTAGFGDFGGESSGAATFGLGLLVLGEIFFVGLSSDSFGLATLGDVLIVPAAIFGLLAAGDTWAGPVVTDGLLAKVSGSLLVVGLSGTSTRGAAWTLVFATVGSAVDVFVLMVEFGEDADEAGLCPSGLLANMVGTAVFAGATVNFLLNSDGLGETAVSIPLFAITFVLLCSDSDALSCSFEFVPSLFLSFQYEKLFRCP